MKRLASTGSVAAACGLILLTNLGLLAAAGWNRRGEPRAQLSLTERELAIPWARQEERTGLELSLVMTHQPPGIIRRTARWKRYELPSVDFDWLNRAKLLELGFRVDLDPTHPDAEDHYSQTMPRRAYLVLEHDGEAWKRWITRREEEVRKLRLEVADGTAEPSALADAEAVLAADRTMRSRLFPVAAGIDADALEHRYGDRRGHVILAALLRPKVVRPQNGLPALRGDILDLVVGQVHVPHTLRQPIEGFLSVETGEEVEARERREAESGWPSPARPRYRAVTAIGRRYEPWLVGMARAGED